MEIGENCKKLIEFVEKNREKLLPLDIDHIREQMIGLGAPITTSEAVLFELLEKYEQSRKSFDEDVFKQLFELYEKCLQAKSSLEQ